ncbi:MAG: gamma-glutamyltransferase [Myxococcota bacterium]|nr:gamma-glutamyltransferase [Myxococcota bacterium]
MDAQGGVVAGGSEPVVDAGAQVLREGGNAIDALVAASLAIASGEPTVTSLGGGGMLIYRDAQSGKVSVLDFFSNAPAMQQNQQRELDFFAIELNYGPATQRFHIGAGSAAVPGMIPGLFEALEKWGSWSVADVCAPAVKYLREGSPLGAGQGVLANFLSPILNHNEATRRAFTQDGEYLRHGSIVRFPALAETLEQLGKHPWREVYNGPIRDAMIECFGPTAGGLITREDLDNYEVLLRDPLHVESTRSTIFVPPPPAAGGQMVGLMRRLIASESVGDASRAEARIRRLCTAMVIADEARFRDRLAVSGEIYHEHEARFHHQLAGPLRTPKTLRGGPPSTTHVSVIDSAGNAAAMTTSHGEGNGLFIGETGILMNNFLGEEDILPMGLGTAVPSQRLATMMTPTIVVSGDGDVLALGTGGSNRIRTAILQVLGRMLDEQMSPQAAVDAPRLHYENGTLSAETFDDLQETALASVNPDTLVRFPERNLFFGGVNLAVRYADGRVAGAGDPRRGGLCRIV